MSSRCILFDSKTHRKTIYPIVYRDIWDIYIQQRQAFWTPNTIDFSHDRTDWHKLNDDEKYFVKNVLAFFAGSDGIVNLNLNLNFINEIQTEEARFAYRMQSMMEDIHSETYSIMIDIYITDDDEKTTLFNAIETIPCVKQKADWAMKWINHDNIPYTMRLIAFAIVEGIFFSGSFCAIYWLKHRNLLPGLAEANEYISRDEGIHTNFACLLYSYFPEEERIDERTVHEIFAEAYDIEKNFITTSLPCNLIGMNSNDMCLHLQFVADCLLVKLGYNELFKVKTTPFSFMDSINYDRKTNFFERRVSDYQMATIKDTKHNMQFTDDF